MILLNQYAIPWLFYQAAQSGVSSSVLHNLDGKIRRTVKKWLHLTLSTCDGLSDKWRGFERKKRHHLEAGGIPNVDGASNSGCGGYQASTVPPRSNTWLRKPAGLLERQYIAALQLHAGVYPTQEIHCRCRSKTVAACWRCSHKLESRAMSSYAGG